MKAIFFIKVIVFICILSGCSPRFIATTWENQHAFPGNYHRIMVVAILHNDDTAYRKKIENHFKESLEQKGYPTVSSFAEFGTSLRDLRQEDTYRTLCEKGIDAVMTVALVDKAKSSELPSRAYAEPVKYFYDRMWHYRDQLPLQTVSIGPDSKYAWEMILFDLSTLQPHYMAQTKTITGTLQQSMESEFWNAFIKKLRKDKFLMKRSPLQSNDLKAF